MYSLKYNWQMIQTINFNGTTGSTLNQIASFQNRDYNFIAKLLYGKIYTVIFKEQ